MISLQIPLVVILTTAASLFAQEEIPDLSCRLKGNLEGTCVPINNCKSALNDIKNNKRPVLCWFDGPDPIVCCERSSKIVTVGSKSALKCKETYEAPIDFPSATVIHAVFGGINSLAQEFPHMAALGFGTAGNIKWACGGSLVSLNFVLTAAHCLNSQQLGEVKFVRLGDLNLKETNDDASPQDFKVLRRIKHPQYKPPMQYNDIGLIELDRAALPTSYVKPACLQTSKEISQKTWIATGWGTLSFGGEQASHLQKVNLKSFSHAICKEAYGTNPRKLNKGIDDNTHVCAGANQKDTCQGDSGGPLQIKNLDRVGGYTIIGITSFGKACGITNSPSVYTRVSYYIDWIESIVWPN